MLLLWLLYFDEPDNFIFRGVAVEQFAGLTMPILLYCSFCCPGGGGAIGKLGCVLRCAGKSRIPRSTLPLFPSSHPLLDCTTSALVVFGPSKNVGRAIWSSETNTNIGFDTKKCISVPTAATIRRQRRCTHGATSCFVPTYTWSDDGGVGRVL